MSGLTFEQFLALREEERSRAFQDLSPYDEPPIFDDIKLAFLKAYPECGPLAAIFVGFGPGLGPYNAISVKVARNVRVPKFFMGVPVVKLVEGKHGQWRNAR